MLHTVVTQSGAVYQFDGMFCYHRGINLGPVQRLKRISESDIEYGEESPEEVILRMENCGPGDLLVGDRFYVLTPTTWRLASAVVSIVES